MSNVIDDIGAWVARTRAPLDHIVASGETLVALARHVVGPEEAERLRLEIEALEHDATPSDIRAEHDATPSDIRAEHDATPIDIRAEHDATPSEPVRRLVNLVEAPPPPGGWDADSSGTTGTKGNG